MKRKILSLILVFAMTVSLLTVGTGAVEPTYGDTAGHWAESSIERWSAYGIIQGSNGQFDPNGQLTCAQLATILAKLLKLPAAKDAGFTDNTADAWYYDAINRCAAAGILNGNGDGTVTPEAPITRERAMVMLARALGIEPIRKPDLTKYTDAAQVSAYAQGYVAAMIEAGIVGGVTADELAPQANINRASTVTILDRAISTYADQAGTTVKADGKGIVLVVAENVKITGAPEGTKIVVADGATGLTVNGKAVSDDQTYIVPKTTTGSGSSSGGYSHSHSYDTTTHKCSCGAFDPAVVATIGDETGYLTLKDAVTAIEDGGTIKLIKDAVGSSIGTYKTPKQADANGDPQIAAKGFTIDFGGHTYTINNPASGSEGYESQGIHLERTNSIIPNVTFLNGKIAVDAKNGKAITMLVQNYCNLTLIDMVVDGSNLSDAYYKIGNELVLGANYTLSNNSKDGAKTLIQNTEIIARSGENHVAFDSDKKSDVTVKGNSIIRGKFEVGDGASLVIIGGTFSSDPSAYVHEGYVATKSETEEIWTVGEGSDPLVAEINGVKYISLPKALAAAKNGDTVKLTQDITPTERIEVTGDKNITIDLAEKKITSTADVAIVNNGTGKLTITGNGTVENSGSEAENIAIWARIGSIDIENGTFINKSNKEATVYAGTSADASTPVITIKGGTFENKATGPYEYKNSLKPLTLNVQNDKPVTSIVITGGTFYGNDPKNGDDNLGGTFLAPDYKSVETSTGVWTVSKMTWNEYPEDASVVPSGLVIQEYTNSDFNINGNTGTITIKDKDALLYFAYKLNPAAAHEACLKDHSHWNHTCIWYGGADARHIVLDADIDLENITLENGFGNMKDFDFDGQGHTIKNVTINYEETKNSGLFVGGNRGISDLVVENVNVIAPNGTENAVGIVSSDANALITNVTVRNSSVTGGKYTGAIVGYNYGSVTNCKVENCTVSGRYKVGGIIGYICNSNDVPTYVTGNTLTGVTVKGEKLVAGKNNFVIGKIVGNWNATVGECSNNKFSGTTDATGDIGEIESRCIVAVNGALHCTLAQFNALTSIPAAAEKVYVDLGNASLQNGLTIGNDNIADHYHYGEWNSDAAPEGFPFDTGRTDTKNNGSEDTRHIYSTGKSEVNIILTGSVTGATDTGDFNAGAITLKVPDAANVIFDTVIFGEGQMAMSMWTESHVQSMTVSHRLASVTFNGCTFKGSWLQNGAFGVDKMTITGCTFEKHENTAGIKNGFNCMNNSNPIWIQNMGQTNVTIEGCTINAVRPIKLWEQGANGSVTISGNTFNMGKCSIDDDNTHKNIAIMFCGTTEQVKLGNVEISGNTVTGDATSLICFYNGRNTGENNYPAMNEGATFRLYNNSLPEGTALSVIWKSNTEWMPSYVQK